PPIWVCRPKLLRCLRRPQHHGPVGTLGCTQARTGRTPQTQPLTKTLRRGPPPPPPASSVAGRSAIIGKTATSFSAWRRISPASPVLAAALRGRTLTTTQRAYFITASDG